MKEVHGGSLKVWYGCVVGVTGCVGCGRVVRRRDGSGGSLSCSHTSEQWVWQEVRYDRKWRW